MPEASAVFVDPTGRRRRVIRVAAIGGATLLLGIVALLVAALLGVPVGPLTSLPDSGSGPAPALEHGQPPAAGLTQPGVTPTSAGRPGDRRNAPAGAVTTTTPTPAPAGVTTTTSASQGNKPGKPDNPPGRPTDLPAPPGHTR